MRGPKHVGLLAEQTAKLTFVVVMAKFARKILMGRIHFHPKAECFGKETYSVCHLLRL